MHCQLLLSDICEKQGVKIISQPIKGTAKRSPDQKKDQAHLKTLQNDPKERSEKCDDRRLGKKRFIKNRY